jgi:hypothetical protein
LIGSETENAIRLRGTETESVTGLYGRKKRSNAMRRRAGASSLRKLGVSTTRERETRRTGRRKAGRHEA